MAAKSLYTAWAQNSSGASTDVPNGSGNEFTSIRAAADAARRQFGSGWTIHIVKGCTLDADGKPGTRRITRK